MKFLPQINTSYWILIISANTLGETVGDLISQTFNLGYGGGTIILSLLFLVTLIISVISKNQKPILYWSLITLSSTLGTTISDFISRSFFYLQLGFSENQGYNFETIILVFTLIMIFSFWKFYSKAITIESGLNKFYEFVYWFAILTSSTLGTAFGDLLAHNTPLGFGGSTLILILLLFIVVILFFSTNLSKEILYWVAIILLHPIGATLGDYMTKPEGLNLGNSMASLILSIIFLSVIVASKWIYNSKTNYQAFNSR